MLREHLSPEALEAEPDKLDILNDANISLSNGSIHSMTYNVIMMTLNRRENQ